MTLTQKNVEFLTGGGEMGQRIRDFDWTKTALGSPENWEQSLKTCVRIMLSSSQPMWIGWGKNLIKLYNDPYKAIVGGKHPAALGQPASVVWADIWADIEPLLKHVMEKDEGTYVESQLLIMDRNTYPEETYYTFSYTPIPGDFGGTAGMICANTDDTARIINERALQTLRDLGKISYKDKSLKGLYSKVAEVLSTNDKDIPFAVFYQVERNNKQAKAVAWSGDKDNYKDLPLIINFREPTNQTRHICKAITDNELVIYENFDRDFDVPKGFWPIPAKQVLYIPLKFSNNELPAAILSIGLNPFRKYDNDYQQFVHLLTDQLQLEMNNMQALELERKRAEALAEVDKAKTVFFNNISHEFRTPLTLMLGPMEELMQKPKTEINERNLSSLETMHRNALRLLKLVNTLLDFSRVESGKQKANFLLVDIVAFTKNLASNFRSIVEKAGLTFSVNADTTVQPVYVDKQMWEKIVFNLLSNAFKYTLTGGITVNLFSKGNYVMLEVSDTGVGIPESELPHMFERFHRVQGTMGRTYEGSGIGLSMIKELVQLHNGKIDIQSKEGVGSTFTVSIPAGKSHLQASQVETEERAEETVISNVYVEEAATLFNNNLLQDKLVEAQGVNGFGKRKTVLVVDDNADMREYIKSLLHMDYHTVTANNGKEALERISHQPPDLVLSDVMMPVLDGLQLLKEIKKNKKTSRIPVILLSARAGEEAKIDGYDIGVDDYIVKPFSAKELKARIKSQFKISEVRQHLENQLKNLFIQAPVAIAIFKGPAHIVEFANERMLELWGLTERQIIDKPVFEAMPEARNQGYEQLLDSVFKTGKRFITPELSINFSRNGIMQTVYLKFVYEAVKEEDGTISGVMALADEITEQVIARRKVEESEKRFRTLAESLPQFVWETDENGNAIFSSKKWEEFTGTAAQGFHDWSALVHPDDLEGNRNAWLRSVATGGSYKCDVRLKNKSGEYHWYTVLAEPVYNDENKIIKWVGAFTDIHAEKMFTEELELQVEARTKELETANSNLKQKNEELGKMNKELQSFAYVSSHDLQEPLRKIQTFSAQILEREHSNLTENGKNYFKRMQDATGRMQQLINDLLAYSRTTTLERKFEKTDLRITIEDVKEYLKEEIRQKQAIIEIGETHYVNIIKFQFHQLIANLISNSLKFSKNGCSPHVIIRSEITSATTISSEKAESSRKYCHISITDNGIGFEPKYRERIFEVFQRLHGQSEYPGTGIGLAIVKKIVENHDGFITATSELNHGATFDIYIPM